MKVIPAIDLMDGRIVRLYKGDPSQKTTYGSDPVRVAQQWESDGADMLHIVDLDAALGRGSNRKIIKDILDATRIPAQMAGGLRSIPEINEASDIAKRVVIGTLAFKDRAALEQLETKQNIVISIDHKDGVVQTHGWQEESGIEPINAIREFVQAGFSEFLLTNIDRDGTLAGPDTDTLGRACMDGANVIASGGISCLQDITRVKDAGAWGVILGKALHDGKITTGGAKGLA